MNPEPPVESKPKTEPKPPKLDPIHWEEVPHSKLLDFICPKCQTLMFLTGMQGMIYCPKCLCYYIALGRICPKCSKEYDFKNLACQDCAPKVKYECLKCHEVQEAPIDPKGLGMKCVACKKCGGTLRRLE